MKQVIISLIVLFLLYSCTPQYNIYHSSVDIPHQTIDLKTNLTLIPKPDDFSHLFSFAFAKDISFADNPAYHYLIVCPTTTYKTTEISELRLYYAINLKPKEVESFKNILDEILDTWDNPSPDTSATFYEFSIIPESQTTQITPNVIEYTPSLKFYFQKIKGNTRSFLILGPTSFQFGYSFREKKDIIALSSMLNQAYWKLKDFIDQ